MPIRPMSFRELLDLPFALIQANLVALAGMSAALLVVVELAVAGVIAGVAALTDGDDAALWWAAVLATMAGIWVLRFALRGYTVALGTARIFGGEPGWRAALARVRANLPGLLAFTLMFTLIGLPFLIVNGLPLLTLWVDSLAFVGLLVFTAPLGLLLVGWLAWLRAARALTVPVIVHERAGYRAATARSKLLVDTARWPNAWLWICHRLLLTVLVLPLLSLPLWAADITGTRRWAVIVLVTSAILLMTAFAEILDATTGLLCYVDRRCRREGMDIRLPDGARW